jgi:F0F1-type ATP synthase membrane subunit b/b'
MTTAALALNLLLALLLVAALIMGWRVEKRLKTLRASHDGFARAVADLDAAAARAEQGLADLRAATDEASESLADRIAKAKSLAARLDERILAGEKAAEQAGRVAAEAAERAERAARSRPAPEPEPSRQASRVESFRRVLEEPRMSPALRLRERLAAEDLSPLKLTETAPPARSRARIDDDLFEEPLRLANGGR